MNREQKDLKMGKGSKEKHTIVLRANHSIQNNDLHAHYMTRIFRGYESYFLNNAHTLKMNIYCSIKKCGVLFFDVCMCISSH